MADREKWGAYGAWAAVCFFWGTTYLAIRVGLETMTPMLLAGLRFLLAGGVLFFVMGRQRNARLPNRREWLNLGFVGLMLLGVGNGAVVWAEQWVPSGMASLLVATSPFWVVAIERFRKDGERVGARGLVGMLVGFVGLALLLAPELLSASVSTGLLLGALAIQLGSVAWVAGSAFAKHRPAGVSPLMAAAAQMLVAGVALTLIGTFTGEWGRIGFSPRSTGALLYLTVFGSIVAYSAYTYALQKLSLSLVSTYSYFNPVIAVLLGWLILAEPLDWRVGAATLIILLGVALIKTSPKELAALLARLRDWRERRRDARDADKTLGVACGD